MAPVALADAVGERVGTSFVVKRSELWTGIGVEELTTR